MSIDNLLICEYSDADGDLVMDNDRRKTDLVINFHKPTNGYITVDESAYGLGIDLDENIEKRFHATPMPVMCCLNVDESIRDQ